MLGSSLATASNKYDGTKFVAKSSNVHFVITSSEKESVIVCINSGHSTTIKKRRLPVGSICHAYIPNLHEVGTHYVYDISFKSGVRAQALKIASKPKIYAIYFERCVVETTKTGNKEIFSLTPPNFHCRIKIVHPLFGSHSLKEYISDREYVVEKVRCMNCWITPIRRSGDYYEWVFVPCDYTPNLVKYSTTFIDNMKAMFSKADIGLGIVVAVGKIAVHGYLINCTYDFELGSTHVCVYKKSPVIGYLHAVLIKSKPVKLKRKYLETFVTPGGYVLIKTVSGQTSMGKWRRAGIPKTKECDTHRKTFLAPEFNFSYHPFLGTILISNKLAWSATGLKIIIGGTMDIANALQSSSEGFLKIRYNLLAFHDGERYWRVPDIPNEMFDSKNFLIEKGVPLWGEPLNTSKKIHPPQSLFKELKIEGRFLSQHFIKHPEKKRPLKSTKKDECDSASMPDSDVSYVLHSSYQVSAGDKI